MAVNSHFCAVWLKAHHNCVEYFISNLELSFHEAVESLPCYYGTNSLGGGVPQNNIGAPPLNIYFPPVLYRVSISLIVTNIDNPDNKKIIRVTELSKLIFLFVRSLDA